jgi:hypothetical protein
MIQPRAKTTTLIRWQSRKDPIGDVSVSESVPYIVILVLLCALSVVSAVKDPLGFCEIFTGM